MAESEARLEIGFLVVDNSGPAAADSEFAASVIDAVAPADEAMFTADVAVDDPNEISQDSSCMLAHSQGTFCRVVHFWNEITAPAVGLSRMPPKRPKLRCVSYGTTCLFLPARTREKKTKHYS